MIIIKFPKLCAESLMDEKLERNIKGVANFAAHSRKHLIESKLLNFLDWWHYERGGGQGPGQQVRQGRQQGHRLRGVRPALGGSSWRG